jgi:threonine/homoserine/homoserine lactone efflux protein
LQIVILGATLCVLATVWFCIVGAFAGQIGAFVAHRPRAGRWITRVSGAILVILGLRLGVAAR